MLLVVVNVCLLKLNLTTCLYSLQRGYSARLFLRVIAGDAVWCLRTDNFGNVQNRVLKIAVRRFFFFCFFLVVSVCAYWQQMGFCKHSKRAGCGNA